MIPEDPVNGNARADTGTATAAPVAALESVFINLLRRRIWLWLWLQL
jgi:hypothetical protein